ncbi:hypothetical protein Tco_0795791 [Tanacetum coccineum]
MAFRTAYKTPIGCTPYKLVYGKACHLPIELEHKAYWALKHTNFDVQTAGDHRKVQLNELNELRDQAYETLLLLKRENQRGYTCLKIKTAFSTTYGGSCPPIQLTLHVGLFSEQIEIPLDFSDCEDPLACSIPQEFHILSFILGIQYPNLIN